MPNDAQRIEIITGHERRRRYTAQEKVRLIEQTMERAGALVSCCRLWSNLVRGCLCFAPA